MHLEPTVLPFLFDYSFVLLVLGYQIFSCSFGRVIDLARSHVICICMFIMDFPTTTIELNLSSGSKNHSLVVPVQYLEVLFFVSPLLIIFKAIGTLLVQHLIVIRFWFCNDPISPKQSAYLLKNSMLSPYQCKQNLL